MDLFGVDKAPVVNMFKAVPTISSLAMPYVIKKMEPKLFVNLFVLWVSFKISIVTKKYIIIYICRCIFNDKRRVKKSRIKKTRMVATFNVFAVLFSRPAVQGSAAPSVCWLQLRAGVRHAP